MDGERPVTYDILGKSEGGQETKDGKRHHDGNSKGKWRHGLCELGVILYLVGTDLRSCICKPAWLEHV